MSDPKRPDGGDDVAFSHAAPAYDVQLRAPGLMPALTRLFAAEQSRTRSTAVSFVPDTPRPPPAAEYSFFGPRPAPTTYKIQVTVFEYTDAAKRELRERWSFDLPTIIRGRLVATTEEWAEVETESPILETETAASR